MNNDDQKTLRESNDTNPCMVEFIGTSGVGKSFIYTAFKEIESSNPDYRFIEKSDYNLYQLFNLYILINSFIEILRCKLPSAKLFFKYFKMCYFTRILMEKGAKSQCKYIVIDEGPLHRIRAIRKNSKLNSDDVRRILLNRRSVISDIVIYLNADPEKIHQWRESRGTRALGMSIEDISNVINDEKNGSNEDIQYVRKNIKNIQVAMIKNDDMNLMLTLNNISELITDYSKCKPSC